MKFKPYKSSKHIIKLPITILTPKIPGKTDSIFYAGKSIASVKAGDKEYILTTSGYYKLGLNEKTYEFDSGDKVPRIVSTLTDTIIKSKVNEENWGFFTIEINSHHRNWITTEEVYSTYDEAIKSFIAFVEKDLIS